MLYLNHVKIVQRLPPEIQFKPENPPIFYKERTYQLYVGEKKNDPSTRIISAEKHNKMVRQMPHEWLDEQGFTEDRDLFDYDYDSKNFDFINSLQSPTIKEKMKQSHGWVHLSLNIKDDSHSVLMRIDPVRENAWFFDPNIGFFCFEAPEKSFDQSVKESLDCFNTLCSLKYSSLHNISVNQRLPK